MNYKKLFVLAKEKGISDLELYISSKKKLSIEVFHKKVERYSVANDEVLSARGIVNGKMGMAFTEDLQNIESVLDLIVKNASNIEDKKEVFIFEGSPKCSNKRFAVIGPIYGRSENHIQYSISLYHHHFTIT